MKFLKLFILIFCCSLLFSSCIENKENKGDLYISVKWPDQDTREIPSNTNALYVYLYEMVEETTYTTGDQITEPSYYEALIPRENSETSVETVFEDLSTGEYYIYVSAVDIDDVEITYFYDYLTIEEGDNEVTIQLGLPVKPYLLSPGYSTSLLVDPNGITTLAWEQPSSTWPDYPVTYDLYLGLEGAEELIASDLDATSYDIDFSLEKSAIYFWHLVIKNQIGETTGDPWVFGTQSDPLTLVFPESHSYVNANSLSYLDWDAVDVESDNTYTVELGLYNDNTGEIDIFATSTTLTETMFRLSGTELEYFLPGNKYGWRVIVEDSTLGTFTGDTWYFYYE